MSLSKHSKAGTGHLPKSVKVRSTCNACQQAKIRCSHEKPSCRRCQKHKIECIYSVSRRLGRPAKKKDARLVGGEGSGSPTPEEIDRPERPKRRYPAKRKTQGRESCRAPATPARGKPIAEDQAQVPAPNVGTDVPGLETNMTPETWLQELISTHVNGNQGAYPIDHRYSDIDLEDALNIYPNDVAYMGLPFSLQPADIYPSWVPVGTENFQERDIGLLQNTALHDQLEPYISKERDPTPWMYAPSPIADMEPSLDPWHFDRVSSMNILIDPASQNGCFESPRASHDASSCSPEDVDVFPAPKESHNFLCGCYKQAVTELERLGLKGRASSMDEILTCQKEWLLQAEAILQCRMCSQSEAQANVLMVLVVAIDSLLSMVDSMAIFSKSGVDEGFNSAGARVKNEPSGRFKPQIEACPLFVGGLRIAADETLCFICQVLKTRLSMMLSMIRRIRGCMQQHLARTSSRGRFLMIIETERRLQLIIMKVKMTAG